jgi:EAL domain-containing protein (putative c-di-GMP-specific phosphodiesterase class I)
VNDSKIQLRLSIGISQYPSDGETYEELVKSACSAMNHAQLAGGNTYRFFDKSVSQSEERQVILRQGINFSLQNNEFFMLYQPKYSLGQQRVVGAEALVRWNHPKYGLISPVEFIPLAESSGAVIEMSEWIIDTVCAQLASWSKQGLKRVPVSINISPLHFWRGDLVGSLQSGLQKWNINTSDLQIEVTENVVMNTSDMTLQVLGRLKELGFKLSIDDFGTGYSSLKYLKDLPISELKIDRSFIIEIPEEAEADDLSRTAIPRAIIRLANEFKLAVVAEGVETENQKKFLVENGCDVIQGYLFSPPISAKDFASMLQ